MMARRDKDFILGLYEVGLIAMKEAPFLACSPNLNVLIRTDSFSFEDLRGTGGTVNGIHFYLVTLKIKTRVSPTNIGQPIEHVYFYSLFLYVVDECFHQQVPI